MINIQQAEVDHQEQKKQIIYEIGPTFRHFLIILDFFQNSILHCFKLYHFRLLILVLIPICCDADEFFLKLFNSTLFSLSIKSHFNLLLFSFNRNLKQKTIYCTSPRIITLLRWFCFSFCSISCSNYIRGNYNIHSN